MTEHHGFKVGQLIRLTNVSLPSGREPSRQELVLTSAYVWSRVQLISETIGVIVGIDVRHNDGQEVTVLTLRINGKRCKLHIELFEKYCGTVKLPTGVIVDMSTYEVLS